ncbi:basic amino acid/polyamine antiporter, APA family [Sphingomonas sp. F9_3S_D5_B_2]
MTRGAPAERKLGFWMVLALVVGTFIGSGIFQLPAQLAPLGWSSVWGWLITIGGAICLAIVFANLSRALPLAAGPYAYVEEAFGRPPAFIVAWSYWLSIWVGNAAIAIAAVSNLSVFVPQLASTPGAGAVAAISIIWILTLVNCLSVRGGGGVQLVTTLIKVVPLIVVAVLAVGVLSGSHGAPVPAYHGADITVASVNSAATLTLWALLGFEAASIATRAVRDPERNVPRATIAGTLIVGLLYLATATPVTLFMASSAVAASNAPFAMFVSQFWSPAAGNLIALFAAISCIGALNGLVLISGEFPLAWARDGVFPRFFGQASRRGIAVRGQILSSTLATILVAANYSRTLAGLFAFMALLATAAALILYLSCAASALRLQATGLMARRWPMTAVAIAAIIYSLWALYGAGLEALKWGAVLLVAGVVIYLFTRVLNRSSRVPELAPAALPE